jgi:hypothetical protein
VAVQVQRAQLALIGAYSVVAIGVDVLSCQPIAYIFPLYIVAHWPTLTIPILVVAVQAQRVQLELMGAYSTLERFDPKADNHPIAYI